MNFTEIFNHFLERSRDLKVLSIATADRSGIPNSASKMVIDVVAPNALYFLEYKPTRSYRNMMENPWVSVSFLDDASFTGFRMTGHAKVMESGPEFEAISMSWGKRVVRYEAERMIRRMQGHYSTKESESSLPQDYVLVRLNATDASVVKPGRIFRAGASGSEPWHG
jgi:general stress protein 26